MKKWIWIPIVLVVLVAGFFGLRWYQQTQADTALNSYQTATVERGSLTASVGATGTIQARQQANLSFAITGRVGKVNYQLGDTVSAGDVVAEMDPAFFTQQVLSAQIDLINAQKALDDLLRSNTALAQAELNLANAKKVYEDAKSAYDRAKTNFACGKMQDAKDWLADADARYKYLQRLSDTSMKGRIDLRQAYEEYIRALQYYQQMERECQVNTNNSSTATQNTLDILKSKFDLAKAQMDDAQATYDRLKNGVPAQDVAAARARIDAATAVLNQTRLTAPFTGTIIAMNVLPGDSIAPGAVVYTLADLTELHVDVPIAEVDYTRLHIGQPATLTLDAIAEATYHGSVAEIGLASTVNQGAVAYPVKVVLSDADGQVLPGMTVAVDIEVSRLENVLLVPNRAVRSQDGSRIVYVMRDGQISVVTVELGANNDLMSEVVSGLVEGDVVILNPPTNMFANFGPGSSSSRGGAVMRGG